MPCQRMTTWRSVSATPPDRSLLSIFVVVAHESSFSRAAAKLGIGKGTVSRAVARLERSVGAELIHRNSHQVSLSTAGLTLFEQCQPHLSALSNALQRLPERALLPSGKLRLSVPTDFGLIVLPDLIASFAADHPGVSFEISMTNSVVDLVGEGFDLAIRAVTRLADSSLTSRRIGKMNLGSYAAPGYLRSRGQPRFFADPTHDWVMFSSLLKAPELRDQVSARDFRPRYVSDDYVLVRDLIQAGAGVGILPRFVAMPLVADGRVAEVPLDKFVSKGWYFLVYPSSGQVAPKVRTFSDFVIARLKSPAFER
jgi:DNA-binding transcriptional LysR family regulator